jgi:hypothetical protein
VLKAWVLYCSGAWSLACARSLVQVLWVSTRPGGLEWLLDECSSDGLPVFATFVAFTALVLAVQLHKMRLVLFAASIEPISSELCFQALFSLVFVGKCAWSRAADRALNESVVHSVLAHGRDLLIFSEAFFMTALLVQHYIQSPWRGRGRRMEEVAAQSRIRRAAAGRRRREHVWRGTLQEDTKDSSVSGPLVVSEAPSEEQGKRKGEEGSESREQALAREREQEDEMLANLQGRGPNTSGKGLKTAVGLALSPAQRAAVHLSAVAPFSPGL